MNQKVKRKSNLNETSNETTNKLRRTNNDENISITCIEDMSNEVFYEIFDYLDGYNIYKTFSNLNIRFQHLINSSSLLFKISLDETLSYCKEVINHNKQHILSLRLCNSLFIDEFFTECIIYSSFDRLESLSLFQISPIKLMTLLVCLMTFPRLFSLRIDFENGYSDHFNEVYRMILHLPSLKYNRLSVLTEEKLNISIPLATTEEFSTIEYLVMSHICDLNELASVLHNTPRLKRFKCQSLVESNHLIENKISITLPSLTHISIDDCRVVFNKFENFIAQICSRLQVLQIKDFSNVNFIYPERWEQLILQNMPHLSQFTLKYHISINDYIKGFHSHTFTNQFTSRFWFERGWSFKLSINHAKIFYLICPNRQHTMSSSRPNAVNSSISFSSPIDISITNYAAVAWSPSFIYILRPVVLSVQFKSLNIFWSGMTLCTLIKLLSLIPSLDSLKISSSLLPTMNKQFINDTKNLIITNNIRKVWQWMHLGQVQFLIRLCPRMEHFEIAGVKDTDLEVLVRFILSKITTHGRHLASLRLHVYNANETMVDKLQYIIDSEKLLSSYIIKRLDNVVSLKWNLK